MKELEIVYMVAGMSSRFNGKVKQLAKIGPQGETLIEYSLKQALSAGFDKIIFIVGEKTEKPFKELFGNQYQGIPVEYVFQKYDSEKRDKPWGTLDALCQIKDIIKSPFIVCNGDDIYGKESFKLLYQHLQQHQTSATLGYKLQNVLPDKGFVNRGIFKIQNNKVISIDEVFDISKENLNSKNLTSDSLCSMNIFALHPNNLEDLNQILIKFKESNKEDRKIESLLPVELTNLIKENKLIMAIYPTPEKWYGLTNPEDELVLKEELKNI
jgi:NDP-sugar pyrophosphorylase family protein